MTNDIQKVIREQYVKPPNKFDKNARKSLEHDPNFERKTVPTKTNQHLKEVTRSSQAIMSIYQKE